MDSSYELKAVAIMTAPRHEIVFARNYIEIALRNAGIPLSVSGGVFYGQCMQRALEKAISDGADVAITVDFDSMFTGEDVTRLLSKLVSYDFDAIASLQCRRGKKYPLMTIAGKTQQVLDGHPFPVATAHFGLTVIDLHKLKEVPKPWFFSQPDDKGEWSADRIDDDIWFWRQWEKAGLSVAIDPCTRIGHLEEVVTYMDEQMQPQSIYPNDWAEQQYLPAKRDGVLVFVGANYGGERIDKLCTQHEKSYLIEPLPAACKKLRETFGNDDTVEIIEAACGNVTGRKPLNIYNELGLSSSLGKITDQAIEQFSQFDLSLQDWITVDVINLSSLDVREIKTLIIDAQGMDLTILKTLEPLLKAGKIQYIECEADGDGFRHYSGIPTNSESEFVDYMAQFNYVMTRKDDRLRIQPDLVFKLMKAELCPA